ncbi:pseudaminic acid cytidylyltransferase [Alteromonas sp. ASW11-36]|uniref:Pseudaminic acid cytidylyltransferase n=1 Tax=Alteromonas arenosi TaxID=3055817 RepID=A0ABT7SVD5_9ALTE|nr:pseudaminic acid cytidylyltransferase [Alteromonas sp. ASW11-36]MDM7860152.1 pseudaminic acid cytidylyltransferase [Alteromonas sp. ASW11-36]
MNIAIIPARGGSKRIPRKNIKAFCGKPMIAYSIEAAEQTQLFDDIVVSTDDEEIAHIAKSYGASVPFMRPATLSDDFTGTRAVTNHAIQAYSESHGRPDFCCCIYATAPFLQARYISQGFNALKDNSEKAFAFSVTTFAFPVQRALKRVDDGVESMYPEYAQTRSQDLDEGFHDAGQFYWGSTAGYLSSAAMFSTSSIPIVIPRYLVQDIDTPEDWQRAELMYQAYMKSDQT